MKRLGPIFKTLGVAVFWLLVWETLAKLVNKELLLPAPVAVLRRFIELALTAEFWGMIALTLLRIACGVLAALVLGTLLAALTERSSLADRLLRPLLTVIKSTPVASFIILALLWMGRDILPGFISALMVLPVVWANVGAGVRETDRELLEVARVFRFSRKQLLRRVYVPSVLPHFLSACKSSIGLGWKAGVAAEVLTVPARSIGRMLYESKLYLETADLFAWTAAVILCSLLIEKLVMAAVGRLSPTYGRGAAV